MKVSPWIQVEHCVCRVIEGTDPLKVYNRVAFIEKTPRVRIRHVKHGKYIDRCWERDDYLNWAPAPWKGSDSDDEDSRKWCDDMLVLLGYELPEPEPAELTPEVRGLVKDAVAQLVADGWCSAKALPKLPEAAIVVTDTGHAWAKDTNPDVEGTDYFTAEQMHEYALTAN